MIDYYETKQHPITKKMVLDAYKKVRKNRGSAGVDGISIEKFEANASKNLYKIWNRLTSGSYYPPLVKEVLIPKKSGGHRGLGIPTISDRIAQQVVKSYLEPLVENTFHRNSYGYRPQRNAHQALERTTRNCGYYSWVVEIDIRGFFDNIDHELMMLAVKRYTQEKWVLMYIDRWLKAGVLRENRVIKRKKGTPQGGVVSPLLANIFLHFAFDKWMEISHPNMPFERYCDDMIIHCTTEKQANFIKYAINQRLKQCKLEMNVHKTRIVYCRNHIHTENHKTVSFDFLGYTFRPIWRLTKKSGWKLTYIPTMSLASKVEVRRRLKKVVNGKLRGTIQKLAQKLNPMIRGWYYYYGKFTPWMMRDLWYWLNLRMLRWLMRYRKFNKKRAHRWLVNVYRKEPTLFEHWRYARPY